MRELSDRLPARDLRKSIEDQRAPGLTGFVGHEAGGDAIAEPDVRHSPSELISKECLEILRSRPDLFHKCRPSIHEADDVLEVDATQVVAATSIGKGFKLGR